MLKTVLMNVAIPIHGWRISPVFDVARKVELLCVNSEGNISRVSIFFKTGEDPLDIAKHLVDKKTDVLICGAVSRPVEMLLSASGVTVIRNTCGPVDEVFEAFLNGELTENKFLMPGCPGRKCGRRRRLRRGHF